jgi:uncharacterized protein
MDKLLLPLLLASDRCANPEEAEPLDRLRMQKGVFLLAMRGRPDWRQSFEFTPYDWGPYSFDLASTIESLLAQGLLAKEAFPGRRYSRYRTTQAGERLIEELTAGSPADERTFICATRKYVTSRPFARLLREVYKAYPAYAVNSRFAG